MIATARAFAKTWVAKLLLGLLIIGLAVFGTQGMLNVSLTNAAIKAGSREVTPIEFRRIFDNYRKNLEQQRGQPIPHEEMVEAGFQHRLAQDLSIQESFAEWLGRIRLRPADALIIEQIRQAPVFFNQVTGAFDKDAYTRFLAEQGLTEKKFEQTLRDELATNQFGAGMVMGLRVPRIYGALQTAYSQETRDVTYLTVTPASVGGPRQPTDEQLTTFVRENAEQLRRPEFRQFTVALFTPASFVNQITVPEADIRRVYEFRKDSMSQAERRTFVQIPVKDPQTAQRVIAGLNGGQDPQAVARSAGVQAVTYDDRPQSAVPDRAVAQAAFALQAGQVSQPIRGELGMSVVKVLSVSPGRAVSFEEARPEIEQALKAEAAGEKVYEAVQKFEEARQSGVAMVEAARAAGAQIVTLPPVTETGQAPNGQRLRAPPAVFEAGFALPDKGESDSAEEGGNGEYFAVKVEQVLPSGLPNVAEHRAELSQRWALQDLAKRMEERAQALAERIRKGETVAAVAASAGSQAQTATGLERGEAEGLGPAALTEIFLRKPTEVFTARIEPFGFAVGKVDALRTPPPALAARAAEDRRPAATQQIFQEMAELARNAARDIVKPKIYSERVNTAVGAAEDAPVPGAATAPAPAGKKE